MSYRIEIILRYVIRKMDIPCTYSQELAWDCDLSKIKEYTDGASTLRNILPFISYFQYFRVNILYFILSVLIL